MSFLEQHKFVHSLVVHDDPEGLNAHLRVCLLGVDSPLHLHYALLEILELIIFGELHFHPFE